MLVAQKTIERKFQSTLSMRRATLAQATVIVFPQFQSTLSMRRATDAVRHINLVDVISIHALHEESDR